MGDVRIGIVGAGFAGLLLGVRLRALGYEDVTIFEAEGEVGGKALSVQGTSGDTHDMGTCFYTWNFHGLMKTFRKQGTEFIHRPEAVVINGSQPEGIKDHVFGENASLWTRLSYAWQLVRYTLLWIRWFIFDNLSDRELAIPCEEFLKKRKLNKAMRYFRFSHTGQLYGDLKKVPMLYVLRWNTPSLLIGGLVYGVKSLKGGCQQALRKLAKTLSVVTNARVIKLRTMSEHTSTHHHVEFSTGTARQFDHLFIASPLNSVDKFKKLSVGERFVVQETHSYEVVSTLIHCETFPESFSVHRHYPLPTLGSPIDGAVCGVRRDDAEHAVLYQYRTEDDVDDKQLLDGVQAFLTEYGFTAATIVKQCRWKTYNPMISAEGIEAGLHRVVPKIQGKNNIWYCGAWVSFESAANVDKHGRLLALEFDSRLKGHGRFRRKVRKFWEKLTYWHW